jgi:hypothetical protein
MRFSIWKAYQLGGCKFKSGKADGVFGQVWIQSTIRIEANLAVTTQAARYGSPDFVLLEVH